MTYYEPRAAGLAAELKEAFGVDCRMIPSDGGVYEITMNDDLIFSKKRLDPFPALPSGHQTSRPGPG